MHIPAKVNHCRKRVAESYIDWEEEIIIKIFSEEDE